MSLAALDAKLEQLRSHYTPSKSDDRKSYMPRGGAMGGAMGGSSMGGMPMGGSMNLGSSMRRRLDPDQVLGMKSLFDTPRNDGRPTTSRTGYPMAGSAPLIPSYGSSSSNNALESMRQMLALQNQLSINHDLARNQQEQLSRDHEFIAQLKDEIGRSKSETEKLRAALADIGREQGPVAQMQEEYRTYRQVMEDREEAYRRMWREEESKVKLVSEETKSNLKIVRDHLIGTLDHVDVSNRSMLEAMDAIFEVDFEMRKAFGDALSYTPASMNRMQASANADSDKSRLGTSMNGNSLVGIDLSEIKGKYGENVRVISNVVQPISGAYGLAGESAPLTSDVETYRQKLITSGYVRASQSEDMTNFA